jgi:aryl carrier-like protein
MQGWPVAVAAGPPGTFPEPPASSHPPSSAQSALWFLEQARPATAVCNYFFTGHLRGALGLEALQRSLDQLILRHEILRTNLRRDGSELQQVVHRQRPGGLAILDPGAAPGPEPRPSLGATLRAFGRQRFDLADGPLFAALLIRLGPDHHLLALCCHYAVFDCASLPLLLADWRALYRASCLAEPVSLAPLDSHFGDYARRQRQRLAGPRRETLLAYWRGHLAGAPEAVEADPQGLEADEFAFPIPPGLLAQVRDFALGQRGTLFLAFLSAFQILLGGCTGQTDLTVGTVLAGRQPDQAWAAIGPFANTLPLRMDLAGDPTLREVFARVRQVLLAGFSHQDLPFEDLVRELRPALPPGRMPWLLARFAMREAPATGAPFFGLEEEWVHAATGSAPVALGLTLSSTGSGQEGRLEYWTGRFERPAIAAMATDYLQILQTMAVAPETRISALGQRPRAWRDGSGPGQPAPHPGPVPAVAPRVAPRTPRECRLALIWADLLGRSDFGILDDFFLLGGDSLRFLRLLAELEAAFGTRLPMADLFGRVTIADLDQALGYSEAE